MFGKSSSFAELQMQEELRGHSINKSNISSFIVSVLFQNDVFLVNINLQTPALPSQTLT